LTSKDLLKTKPLLVVGAALLPVVAALLLFPPGVLAQPRGSERGSMTQTVNGTTITVDFGRPVARGNRGGRPAGRPMEQGAIALVPAGPAEFIAGFLRNGGLFDVAAEMTLLILTEDGVSTGAELLWESEVFGTGVKVGG
jgi:hypothetical protein